MTRITLFISVLLLGELLGSELSHGQSVFRRGDADGDGRVVPIADAWWLINGLFSAGPVPCPDAHDVNDDGLVDIVDVVDLLSYGYVEGSPPIPAPGPLACGVDPTPDTLDCGTYVACVAPPIDPPDPNLVYRLPTRVGEIGATMTVVLELDNEIDEELVGWSIGICHDPAIVTLDSVELGDDVFPVEPDFWSVISDVGGFGAGTLVSFVGFTFLGSGVGIELFAIDYDLVGLGATPLEYCDQIVDLTLANHVLLTYETRIPEQIPGEVTVIPATLFRRGDANGDGLFDVADPIFGLMFMFAAGTPPLCNDAGDSNDDGVLDIGDAVHMLNALFEAGSPQPPAPGPHECGVDPTSDSLDCDSPPSCG